MTSVAYLKGNGRSKNYQVDCKEFDIGRRQDAKACITDLSVSRNHCSLIYQDDTQQWSLVDHSTTGTSVNGQLVGKENSAYLRDGDVIHVGAIQNHLQWIFYYSKQNMEKSSYKKRKLDESSGCDVEAQSQAIEEMCEQKNNLEKRINAARCQKQSIEQQQQKLIKEYEMKIIALENGAQRKLQESSESKAELVKQLEEDKQTLAQELERKKISLEEETNKNAAIENELKQQVESLMNNLAEVKHSFEETLQEEKLKKKELEEQKLRVEQEAKNKEQELNEKLKEKEEESRKLAEKIAEMESMHLLEKANLEEKIKIQIAEKEEELKKNLEGRIQEMTQLRESLERNLKDELEKKESAQVESLLLELNQIKSSLSVVEGKKTFLEKELEKVNSSAATEKTKSDILINFQDLMETELQCSICNELFITAITLNCTHTFCKSCICQWKKKKKDCPVCRTKIKTETRSLVMDNYIDKMIENLTEEMKERRKQMIDERSGTKKKAAPHEPSTSTGAGTSRNTYPAAIPPIYTRVVRAGSTTQPAVNTAFATTSTTNTNTVVNVQSAVTLPYNIPIVDLTNVRVPNLQPNQVIRLVWPSQRTSTPNRLPRPPTGPRRT